MRISDQAYNRHKVLKAVRGVGPISRTELAALTGLSGATITDVIADLVARGLVREERAGNGGRGRPRIEISIDPEGGMVIGAVLLPGNLLSVNFVDLSGERQFLWEGRIGMPATLADYAARMASRLAEAIAQSPFELDAISRIAVALPALVDSHTGIVHWLTTFDEPPFPFAQPIAERLGIPVTIENGSTCLARAEHWFGSAKSLETFSLFHVDLWVDSAQYADGLPRVGGNGFNSEIGHVKTAQGPGARRCLCGARGCLAVYGSIYGILLGSGALEGADLREPLAFAQPFDELAAAAAEGDEPARSLFDEAGDHLGRAVADHINAFDPGHVFIVLSDARLKDLITPALEASLQRNVFRPLLARTAVSIDLIADDWRWKGTAAHALEQTYLRDDRG